MTELVLEQLFVGKSIFGATAGMRDDRLKIAILDETMPPLDDDSLNPEASNSQVRYSTFNVYPRYPAFELEDSYDLSMSIGVSATLILEGSHAHILHQLNFKEPSRYTEWDLTKRPPDEITNRTLGVSDNIAESVIVPSDWCTRRLRSDSWLFGPRLAQSPHGRWLAAFNLADGKAILWDAASAADGCPPVALIANVIDPTPVRYREKQLLVWRKPTADWEVYENTPMLGCSFSRALPLYISELRGSSLVSISNGIESIAITNSIIFDANSDGKRILIASVEREASRFRLRLIISEDGGQNFRELGGLFLDERPRLLSCTLHNNEAVVVLMSYRDEGSVASVIRHNF